jgi:hypothetical protein
MHRERSRAAPKTVGNFEILKGDLTMLLKTAIVAAICGSTFVSLPSFGQENPQSRGDISSEACMPFVENTNANGAPQSVSANYGFLGIYRLFFNKRSDAELSYGRTRNTQAYGPKRGPIGVKNSFDEMFATFVFQLPAKRWSPVVFPSTVIFDAGPVMGTGTQTQGGYLYGSASTFSPKHRSLPRTGHRGDFYNSATPNIYGRNGLDRITNREEPPVIFGYTF